MQLGHVDVKHGIPVKILLVWSKTLFEEQTKCFCAFRHECLLRCKDISLLKALYFWEYCCLSVYGIPGKTHTIDFEHAYNARGKPSSKECFDMLETCFFNMLLTTSISLQFVASFDV